MNRRGPRSGAWWAAIFLWPLEDRPAVVGGLCADVDLFPGILADIADEEISGRAIKAVAKRIAQTERKDLAVRAGRPDERVVGRDRIVVFEIGRKCVAMYVDAQDLAEHIAQRLRVRRSAVLAGRDIEVAVRAESDPAGIVVCRAEIIERDNRRLAGGIGDAGA